MFTRVPRREPVRKALWSYQPPRVVDEFVIRILTGWQARAKVEEHITDEDVTRWMIEAWNLIPDDAPEDLAKDTFIELVHRERPEVMRSRWARRAP